MFRFMNEHVTFLECLIFFFKFKVLSFFNRNVYMHVVTKFQDEYKKTTTRENDLPKKNTEGAASASELKVVRQTFSIKECEGDGQ